MGTSDRVLRCDTVCVVDGVGAAARAAVPVVMEVDVDGIVDVNVGALGKRLEKSDVDSGRSRDDEINPESATSSISIALAFSGEFALAVTDA